MSTRRSRITCILIHDNYTVLIFNNNTNIHNKSNTSFNISLFKMADYLYNNISVLV